MSDTSYEITRLQSQSQRLTEEKQSLAETNERLGTPQELERQAREHGMVPVSEPAYIDLDTGAGRGPTATSEQTAPTPEPTLAAAEAAAPPAQTYDAATPPRGMPSQ